MRRSVTFTLVWLVAAGVATAAAWGGVAIVTNQVTNARPGSLSADQVEDALGVTDASDDGTASSTTSTSTSTTTPTSTTAPAAAPIVQTYNLIGGTVAIRFTPAGATFEWARPNDGFSEEHEPEDGNGLKVEFESESHRSRIDAWWDGGPQIETREDDDSGGGSGRD